MAGGRLTRILEHYLLEYSQPTGWSTLMGKPVRRHGGEFPQPSVGAPKNAAIVDHDLGLSEQPWTSPMLLGRLLAADSGGYLACFKNRCRIQRGPPQSFARKVGWLVSITRCLVRGWLPPLQLQRHRLPLTGGRAHRCPKAAHSPARVILMCGESGRGGKM